MLVRLRLRWCGCGKSSKAWPALPSISPAAPPQLPPSNLPWPPLQLRSLSSGHHTTKILPTLLGSDSKSFSGEVIARQSVTLLNSEMFIRLVLQDCCSVHWPTPAGETRSARLLTLEWDRILPLIIITTQWTCTGNS